MRRAVGVIFQDFVQYDLCLDENIGLGEIDRVRDNNPDLKIRAGIELDNDPIYSAAGREWVEQNWEKLDFVLGSVHFLEQDSMFDSVPAGASQFEGRDIDAVYADYFRRVRDIAATGLVDCLAHLDLIKIHAALLARFGSGVFCRDR